MDLPKRKQTRLAEYDYSLPNAYFITICTDKRENLLWDPVGATIGRPESIKLSLYGVHAEEAIGEITQRYPTVFVDHYAIMPNHVHLLLRIDTDDSERPIVSPTVSQVVQQMKGIVSKRAGRPLWQKGFYDHVVRGREDYREIWSYIENNPVRWLEDQLYRK